MNFLKPFSRPFLSVLLVCSLVISLCSSVSAATERSSKSPAPDIYISNDQLVISYSGSDVTIWAIYVSSLSDIQNYTTYYTGDTTFFDLSSLELDPGTYKISVCGCVSQTPVTEESTSVSYLVPDDFIEVGQYVCKDSLLEIADYSSPASWPSSLNKVYISFTSSGVPFSSISTGTKLGSAATWLYYDSVPVYCYGNAVEKAGWVSTSYGSRFVSFFDSCFLCSC